MKYDDEAEPLENIGRALFEIASSIRYLMHGTSDAHPLVEAAFILQKALEENADVQSVAQSLDDISGSLTDVADSIKGMKP